MTEEIYMKMAYDEAMKAYDEGEVPIGAVVVCENKIIARCHNQTEMLHDVTAHAEMLAITAAENYINGKYLDKCTLYVTLEPCVMCAGALSWSQIGSIVYACSDEKRGCSQFSGNILHPKTVVRSGVLEEICRNLLLEFFREKRKL